MLKLESMTENLQKENTSIEYDFDVRKTSSPLKIFPELNFSPILNHE